MTSTELRGKSVLPKFLAACGLANLADGVAVVVWAWLASLMTRDALLISLVPVALRLPWFLFALPAGVITDRIDRRNLILITDTIRGAAFALVALVLLFVPLLPPLPEGLAQPQLFMVIFALALIVGTAEVFRDNAAQTMMPSLVPPEKLEYANGRLWSVELVGDSLLGPAIGAFLIAAAVPLPFALNAVAFVCSVALISSFRGRFTPEIKDSRNWRRELAEGLNFLKNAPLLRLLAVITGLWNLFFHMVAIGLILHAQENLGMDARAYGLMFAAAAVGGIAGGWSGEKIVKAIGPGRTAQLSLALTPLSFLGIILAPNGWILAATLAVFEFWGITWNTVSVAYRQRNIPDILLGRVNSIYRLLAWGMIPLGLLISGLSVQLAENLFSRSTALLVPFVLALVGATALAALGWRPLGKGFART